MSKRTKTILGLLAIVMLLFPVKWIVFSETAYEKQTHNLEQKLINILKESDDFKRRDTLEEFARFEVGTGIEHTVFGTPYKSPTDERVTLTPTTRIHEDTLVNNIYTALQYRSARCAHERAMTSNVIASGSLLVAALSLIVSLSREKKCTN